MPSVLLIGAGFGGIGTAVELRRSGFTDVTVVEKATELSEYDRRTRTLDLTDYRVGDPR